MLLVVNKNGKINADLCVFLLYNIINEISGGITMVKMMIKKEDRDKNPQKKAESSAATRLYIPKKKNDSKERK